MGDGLRRVARLCGGITAKSGGRTVRYDADGNAADAGLSGPADEALESLGRMAIDLKEVAYDIERDAPAWPAIAAHADRLRDLAGIADGARRTLKRSCSGAVTAIEGRPALVAAARQLVTNVHRRDQVGIGFKVAYGEWKALRDALDRIDEEDEDDEGEQGPPS